MDFSWEMPVIVFYKERTDEPEREAFLVVKAQRLSVRRIVEPGGISGTIKDFFPLMGDIDYISSKGGVSDHYVLCWFDNSEQETAQSWRRLTGVTFPGGAPFDVNAQGKKTHSADFRAQRGKLK